MRVAVTIDNQVQVHDVSNIIACGESEVLITIKDFNSYVIVHDVLDPLHAVNRLMVYGWCNFSDYHATILENDYNRNDPNGTDDCSREMDLNELFDLER